MDFAMDEALLNELINYLIRKFPGHAAGLAEDIVNEAWLSLRESRAYNPDKENFGYLSRICVRLMVAALKRGQIENSGLDGLTLISAEDIVSEIIEAEEAKLVLDSLQTLRDIERIVVTQRYYFDFSFRDIAEENNLNLNTVLSHHRRALQKLRPKLTGILGFGKEKLDYEK